MTLDEHDLRTGLQGLADQAGPEPADLLDRVHRTVQARRRARVAGGAALALVVAVGAGGAASALGGGGGDRPVVAGTPSPTAVATPPTSTPSPSVSPSASASASASPVRVPGQARSLLLTEEERTAIGDAWWRHYVALGPTGSRAAGAPPPSRSEVSTPRNVYFGVVTGADPSKDVYWAVAYTGTDYDGAQSQDGPDSFTRTANDLWRYVGDTGGAPPCEVPTALLDAWNYPNRGECATLR